MNGLPAMTFDSDIMETLATYGSVCCNASLKEYTTFQTGGPADILIHPNTHQDVADIVCFAYQKHIPLTVIGGGSNLLVGDKGIRGIVVRMSENVGHDGHLTVADDGLLYADAIVPKERFIEFAVEQGYAGVEFMVGIPGCIGGGIVMNAGTYMGTFADVLRKIIYIDTQGAIQEKEISADSAHYRALCIDDMLVVIGGYFSLSRTDNKDIVRKRIEDILLERKAKHPLQFPSAGSVFKNPEGYQSWKLVDDAGLKGLKRGGAMVSDLHTNFIVNADNASSRDIKELIAHVQKTVLEKFSISLHTEIKMIGEY